MTTKTAIQRRGLLLVLSSPSGAGKTSIAKALLETDENLTMSISTTTRLPRPGETEGVDYFFKSESEFQKMIENDAFLEHANVFGHSYGTPKQYVFDAIQEGQDIIFDIDWQGTQKLALYARHDLVSVFILPPSTEALQERLEKRGQDSPDVVRYRMNQAANEMSHWAEYDYVVVNEDLEKSIKQVQEILNAERQKRTRLLGLVDFVNTLRNNI